MASTASCHSEAGRPGASANARAVSRCAGGQPSDRAEPVQVGGKRRVHGGGELRARRGSAAVSSCRPWDRAISPAMRKFCPDMRRDPVGERAGERLIGVGVAGPFVPGQLQAGQRVGGQVFLGEVAGVVQVDHGQAHRRSGPAGHRRRRGAGSRRLPARRHPQHVSASGSTIRSMMARAWARAGRLIERVDDHVEPRPAAPAERVTDGRCQVFGFAGQGGRCGAGDLLGDFQRGLGLGVHRAAHRSQAGPDRHCHQAAATARMSGSAVVTIRPSTADLPTPGEPVTTSTRRSGPAGPARPTISVSAAVRPRNRQPALAVDAHSAGPRPPMPHPLGIAGQGPPPLLSATSPAASADHLASVVSLWSGSSRSAWCSVIARPSPLPCA